MHNEKIRNMCPVILENPAGKHYALLDSGDGLKLERYGDLRIIRPEGQAIWRKQLPKSDWDNVDAVFTGDMAEEGAGRWSFPRRPLPETWAMQWNSIRFLGRFTSFRHVGVFPEQAMHWEFMDKAIRNRINSDQSFRLLNLFGYTGIASLVAAAAGAQVTHIDASRKAVGWARENQELSGLSELPIRWICEDAVRFCHREVRRGNTYDGIILDPPKYGRGPKGEKWQLFEDLSGLLCAIEKLLSRHASFVLLTSYSIRASSFAMHEIMQDVFSKHGGKIESGELVLATQGSDRRLSTSLFSRWIA